MITTPETYFEASLFKRCSKCGVEKALAEFSKNTAVKDGRRPDCRACGAEANRRYRQTPEGRAKKAESVRRWRQNPENRAKVAERMRRWYANPENRAKHAERMRRWSQSPEGRAKGREALLRWRQNPENRAKDAEGARLWYAEPENRAKKAETDRLRRQTPEFRAKHAEYLRRRRQTNPQFRLAHLLRNRLRHALKGTVKSARTLELLGCSIEHLVKHLESKFQPGMSWENQGEWHVDHIRPLASFDLSDPHQQREACHWTNLQPLWASDNIRKGDKL